MRTTTIAVHQGDAHDQLGLAPTLPRKCKRPAYAANLLICVPRSCAHSDMGSRPQRYEPSFFIRETLTHQQRGGQ
jgi:hypothetical protein